MVTNIYVTNDSGKKLNMDLMNPNDCGVAVRSVTGLGYPTINTEFNEVNQHQQTLLGSRNIVFTLAPLINGGTETNRTKIYNVFLPGSPVYMTFTIDDSISKKTKTITGYVETCEPDIFSNLETVSISMLCSDPYFIDENEIKEAML